MRRDAEEHRARLIDAARIVFARDGADAPLETVLAEAGLGRGTLYRHFRNRIELAIALMRAELEVLAAFVEAHGDDATLLGEFLRRQSALAAIHAGPAAIAMSDPPHASFTELLGSADLLYERIIARSRRAGIVATGFDVDTLRLVTRMLAAAVPDYAGGARQPAPEAAITIVLAGVAPR